MSIKSGFESKCLPVIIYNYYACKNSETSSRISLTCQSSLIVIKESILQEIIYINNIKQDKQDQKYFVLNFIML